MVSKSDFKKGRTDRATQLFQAYYDAKAIGDMDALDIAINDIFKELGIDMKSKGGSIEKAIR
tara:strand:+ start:273 stop:458 length:186 start_codon:yes stop_codon:yes gene_type:complete